MLISPSGGKWWRLKYRFEGKEKLLSLGVYPAVGLKEARRRRDEAREQLAHGIDPSTNRKAVKAAQLAESLNSYEVIAREWFEKYSVGWSESNKIKVIARQEKYIFPFIGGKPISKITPPELLEPLRHIEKRGSVDTAHRALQDCSRIFRYAIATVRAERDTAADLRGALPPVQGSSFATITDPKAVGELLRAIDGYEGSITVACALRLAPLVLWADKLSIITM